MLFSHAPKWGMNIPSNPSPFPRSTPSANLLTKRTRVSGNCLVVYLHNSATHTHTHNARMRAFFYFSLLFLVFTEMHGLCMDKGSSSSNGGLWCPPNRLALIKRSRINNLHRIATFVIHEITQEVQTNWGRQGRKMTGREKWMEPTVARLNMCQQNRRHVKQSFDTLKFHLKDDGRRILYTPMRIFLFNKTSLQTCNYFLSKISEVNCTCPLWIILLQGYKHK